MKKRVICITLLLIWMGVIFWFSSENGEASSKQSGKITNGIVKMVDKVFDLNMSEQGIMQTVSALGRIVRKSAHFLEYALLAVLAFLTIGSIWKVSNPVRFAGTTGFVFLYAVSDEIHQLFVPGRVGCFQDVMIDTSGGILACIIILFVTSCRTRR